MFNKVIGGGVMKRFQVLETIVKERSWELLKVFSQEDKKIYTLKKLKNKNPTLLYAETSHDYHISNLIKSPFILKPVKIEKFEESHCILMKNFSGKTLRQWEEDRKQLALNLHQILQIALNLTNALASLHQESIIHNLLQPQFILLDASSLEIKLTGFQHASTIEQQIVKPIYYDNLIYDSMYWSPEQSGRINRTVDQRSDLYSLGVIFYEAFCGRLPFTYLKHAEMVHAHLTEKIIEPHKIRKTIPVTVSKIITKLLEKSPNDRYQNAHSLKNDLEKCLQMLVMDGKIIKFKIGKKDQEQVIQTKKSYYGQENLVRNLQNLFLDFTFPKNKLGLITGLIGSGKTTLANQLEKVVIDKRGYFISGKFVELKQDNPYEPFIHAFQSLVKQIMIEGVEAGEYWRERIKVKMPLVYRSIMVDFVPELNFLIDDYEAVPTIAVEGLHQRFLQAVNQFFHVFTDNHCPLVLFIDDIQWADEATTDMIQFLLSNCQSPYLMIICACREHEAEQCLFKQEIIKSWNLASTTFRQFLMRPLTMNEMKLWLNDMIQLKEEQLVRLAQTIFFITKGNPLFTEQLFRLYLKEKVIKFDLKLEKWEFHDEKIIKVAYSNSIIEMIVNRIEGLTEITIKALKYAASFGNEFEHKQLAEVMELAQEKLAEILKGAVTAGILIAEDFYYIWLSPVENRSTGHKRKPKYIFTHDYVQQTIYNLIPENKRAYYHYKIANYLMTVEAAEVSENTLFDLIHHFKIAEELMSEEELTSYIKMNIKAGNIAIKRGAMKTALDYYKNAAMHIGDDRKRDKLYFITMYGLADVYYLTQQFEASIKTLDKLLASNLTTNEMISIYRLKIRVYTHSNQLVAANTAGMMALDELGFKVNKNPSKLTLIKELMKTKLLLFNQATDDLLHLPQIKNDKNELLMKTIIDMNAAAFHLNPNMATVLMLKALQLTIKYGDMDATCLIYNNYSLTLSAAFKDYQGSFKFADLAMKHLGKFNDTSLQGRVYFVYGSFVSQWKEPLSKSLTTLNEAQRLNIESGNLHLASVCTSFIASVAFSKGQPIQKVLQIIEEQLKVVKQYQYRLGIDYLSEMLLWLENLADGEKEVDWNFPEFTDDISAKIIHFTFRLQMTYLFLNKEEAEQIISAVEKIINNSPTLIITPDYFYYYCLWIVKQVDWEDLTVREASKKIKYKLKSLKKWAVLNPDNYLHKFLLIEAEYKRILNQSVESLPLYLQALENAEKNGFLQDVAMINKSIGLHFIEQKLHTPAKAYLTEAYDAYILWGAEKAAHVLYALYPEYISDQYTKGAFSITLENEFIDVDTILAATKTIASEINFDELIAKLLDIISRYAGAEKVHLVLKRGSDLEIVASYNRSKVENLELTKQKLSADHKLSLSIIHVVLNTKETVVLGQACKEGSYVNDPYIKANQIKSVLCIPIVHQQKVTGVLYLENNQMPYAFTKNRVVLLTLLASQAATSIENAHFYEELESKVVERTNELKEANEQLLKANQSLALSKEQRGNLLANISHDLRTPIVTANNHLTALLDGVIDDPDKQHDYLLVVKNRLRSLNNLIQDLFDITRLESGNLLFQFEAVPVDQLFKYLCRQYDFDMRHEEIIYKWSIDEIETRYPLVEIDINRIVQVMNNLVFNAVKHGSPSTIKIELAFPFENRAVIHVHDNGKGITEADLDFVFDRFYSNQPGNGQATHGLGLAISKEIIEQHKGSLVVSSTLGKGTTFSITLPTFDVDF